MKPQPPLNKKWTLIYSLATITLAISIYYLSLPLDTKLRFFCTIDDAHIAETPPTWNPGYWPRPFAEYVNGYWTNTNTGTKLAMITIREAIDAGMWLYYDNTENIFWIGVQRGPMKGAFYGPYQGTRWMLTNIINPLALAGITLSITALIHQPIRKLWTKDHTTTAATFKEAIITVSKQLTTPEKQKPTFPNSLQQHGSSSQRTRGADYYF